MTNKACAVTAALALSACGGKHEPDRASTCGRIEQVLATCAPPPSEAMMSSFRTNCPMYADAPIAKAALETCATKTSCTEVGACLTEHRCSWILTRPDDRDPQFNCL